MKTTVKLTFLVLVTVLAMSCNTKSQSQSQSDAIKVITPTEFKEKSVNHTIIDVRTPQEFNEGHIDGAININVNDEAFKEQITKLDKSKPVFVYCRSGKRSAAAAAEMSKAGFKQVYDLEGGILNWMKNNNEVIK